MLTCEQCRSALLDRHYGLTDAAEAAALDAHLSACVACQAEQRAVERFGRLVSAAARSEFPDVKFVAPVEAPGLAATRRLGGAEREGGKSELRKRGFAANHVGWAIAAGLLLAIGVPTWSHVATVTRQETTLAAAREKFTDLDRRRRETASKYTTEVASAAADVRKTEEGLQAAESTLAHRLSEAQTEALARQLHFVITGPAALQAGAPAEYRLETRDNGGRPVPATVTYRVKDGTEKVVFEEKAVKSDGTTIVKLPPDMPLKPNTELFLEVAAARADGPKAELREQLKLAAPVYVTHLTTDKPLYQPREVVRFRSLTLDRATLKPAADALNLQFVVRDALGAETPIVAGTSEVTRDDKPIVGPDGQPVRGVGAGEWTIPAEARGGEYTLAVKEAGGRFAEERRKFLVNQYTPALLNKELEWAKKSFGPGDEVVANCKVTNASGPVAGQPVSAQAYVDGQPVAVPPCGPTSADGTVAVRFTLPKQIEKGEASLSVIFTDGGSHDTLTKPVPVALKKLSVEFFAEGGELVAGAANRMYFQARTTLGKPADLKGRIVDESDHFVTTAETLTDAGESGINQGMGRFEFTPEVGQTYRLLIDQPAGTEGEYKLPGVRAEGVVLTALGDVSGGPEPIRVRVTCPSVGRTLLVGAYARGRLLDHRRVTVAANQSADVELRPEAGVGGVTRVTVFEELPGDAPHKQLQPRAERLVFRRPAAALTLTAEADKKRYVPGDHVGLSIKARDEKGEPAAAVAMVGVVNQSVVSMADEKTFRTMPTHFLLTSEVRQPEDLEHADVLLGTHPKAAAALDLLLGTQGWRRFAEQAAPPARTGDDADGIRVAIAHSPERVQLNSIALAQRKVETEFAPAVERERARLAERSTQLGRLRADTRPVEEVERLSGELRIAQAAVQSAQADLTTTLAARERTLAWALPAGCGLFLVVALGMFVVARWQGFRYYVAAAGSLGLAGAAAVVLALHTGGGENRSTRTAMADASGPASSPVADLGDFGVRHLDELRDVNGPMPPAGTGMPERFWRDGGAGPEGRVAGRPAAPVETKADVAARKPGSAPAAPAAQPVLAPMAGAKVRGRAADKDGENAGVFQRGAEPAGKDAKRRLAVGEAKKEMLGDDAKPRGLDRAAGLQREELADKQLAKKKDEPAQKALVDRGAMRNRAAGGRRADGDEFGEFRAKNQFGFAATPAPPPPPFVVREYAHRHTTAPAGDRTDFAETVFWHPVLVLPKDGANVSFDLGDDVTRYQVLVAAHTLDGRLGAVKAQIESRKPFSLEPKLPVEISAGDRIDVPVTLANDTDSSRTVVIAAHPKGLTLTGGSQEDRLALAPQQRARRVFQFKPAMVEGMAELRLTGRSEPFGDDAVVRTVQVVPDGFPINGSISDVLEGVARHQVVLPETWVTGTLKCQVNVYPSTLAELQKGLDGLLQEPGGCFEQTSTTNYPNTLILEYLRESDQANPDAMKRAKGLLERGYAKLTAFEVPAAQRREGFEWFGQSPAHEALTAYGLMQFRDMARVTDVDPQLLKRTRDYLLARRDGKGGFTRNPLALDTFGRAPADVTNAYIVWALTEGGKDDDVPKELSVLVDQAKTADDPYFLALVANSLINRDRADEAAVILRKLAGKLTKDGYLDGGTTSVTGSTGRMLQIETTALAVLGWLKSNRPAEFTPAVRSAVGWIGKQRGGGGAFGSTQSTILALKALIAYTKANKKTPEAGELSFAVGDRVLGKVAFSAGEQRPLTIDVLDPERQLKPGKNDVRVEITGKNTFPYTLAWSYRTVQPPSAEGCAVRLTTALDRGELAESDAAQLRVKLENVSGKGQGMAVAIVGLPAGLKLPDDFAQLKDLCRPRENGTKPGKIGAFEVRGRELVLYWRDLAPDAKIELSVDVRANVPGVYHGPASRAYLYYNPDAKHWTAPLAATIAAK